MFSQEVGAGSFQKMAERIAGLEECSLMIEDADRVSQGLENDISVEAKECGSFRGLLPTAVSFP
jgi:hypothetical protein